MGSNDDAFKVNPQEKSLDDFEGADRLDDEVPPPQQAVRLVRSRQIPTGFFASLREDDGTLIHGSKKQNKKKQWKKSHRPAACRHL